VFVEIQDGITPKKVCEENISYKAAGAAYDFIKFELGTSIGEDADEPSLEGSEIIRKMRLVERFERYLNEKHYLWWSVIYYWMRSNLSDALATEFNRRLDRGRVHYSIDAYFPILCVNGRLWQHSAAQFAMCSALLTRMRVSGWPGNLRQRLIHYTTEVPLVVTNPDGLAELLHAAKRWFLKVEKNIKSADKKTKQRWHMEAVFCQEAVAQFMRREPHSAIRSDLDFFDLMQNLGRRR
jgi:hypothetical protein